MIIRSTQPSLFQPSLTQRFKLPLITFVLVFGLLELFLLGDHFWNFRVGLVVSIIIYFLPTLISFAEEQPATSFMAAIALSLVLLIITQNYLPENMISFQVLMIVGIILVASIYIGSISVWELMR